VAIILGVDIGTGSTKVLAMDEETGKVVTTAQVAYPTHYPQPHWSEQSPDEIRQAFVTCISQVTKQLSEPPAAIGISSAMHSVIPVDASGKPLMNMMTWADGRSVIEAEELLAHPVAKDIYEATGTPIHAMSPLCKIIWLRKNNPELFTQTVRFISIKEYIWYHLFGEFETDYSIASGSGMFNIHTLTWHPESLQLAGIRENQLPTPMPPGHTRTTIKADVARQMNIPASTPIAIGGSDGCLANLGSNAIRPGIASLTIGTSGAIRVASHSPCLNFKSMIFNYRLDENLFISGGPINNGGTVIKWFLRDVLKHNLDDKQVYADLLQETASIPAGSAGLIFLPYILGERAPIWNIKASGVFFCVTHRHTQAHFTKAVLESISMALYSVSNALEEASGNISMIYASGGFVHSDVWLQTLCNVFNKPVVKQKSEDASAIGAACIAIKAIRHHDHYPVFATQEEEQVLIPDQTQHARYDTIYPIFRRLYNKLKDEMDAAYTLSKYDVS